MSFIHKLGFIAGVIAVIVGLKIYSYPPDIVTPRIKVFAMDHLSKFSFQVVAPVVHALGWDNGDPIVWRQQQQEKWRKVAPNDEPGYEITWMEMDGVRVLSYLPTSKSSGQLPAIVFFHGGGWAYFDPDFYDKSMTRALVRKLGLPFFSVEYRKAPAHPYPAALDDCYKVVQYLVKHGAKKFNIDKSRIAVMGDSAGGNLAAALTLKLKTQKSAWQPKLQVLIYPGLQMFDFQHPSMAWPYDIVLSRWFTIRAALAYMGVPRDMYLSDDVNRVVATNNHTTQDVKRKFKYLLAHSYLAEVGGAPEGYESSPASWGEDKEVWARLKGKVDDPLAWPLMASEAQLAGLPPAYIITCQYDVLRDHGLLYAHRLEEAGVTVQLSNMGGGFHGILSFNSVINFPGAEQEEDKMVGHIKNTL